MASENQKAQTQASIAELTQVAALKHMKDHPHEWFDNLPPATQAQLFLRYIPASPRPTDQELEATALSLDSCLEGLPEQTEQSREVYAMRKELEKMRPEMNKLKAVNKAFRKEHPQAQELHEAFRAYSKSIRKYYAGRDDTFMTDKEMDETIKRIFL